MTESESVHGELLIRCFPKTSSLRNRGRFSSIRFPTIFTDLGNCPARIDLQRSLNRALVFAGPFDLDLKIANDFVTDEIYGLG